MNITFIGGGNMATALIGGMLAKGFDATAIHVVDPAPAARQRLSESLDVVCFESVRQLASLDDVIVLAVKPQQMRAVSADLRGRLSDQLVLSIAAGIRLGDLSRWLGEHDRLARCMPNTPALIGQGISGLYANQAVSAGQRD